LTETAMMADVVLPAQAFTEREGSFTNGERRVQRFYPAVPPRPECLPDFQITARLGQKLDLELEGRAAMLVMQRISTEVAGYTNVTYLKMAEVQEQWPIVGREDLYYGGTTYGNRQGLGVKLAPLSAGELGPTLSWNQPVTAPEMDEGLLGVPVTRLFDRAQTLIHSKLLVKARIPEPYVAVNPADAERLKITHGAMVTMEMQAASPEVLPVQARLDENVPAGVVLVPRSMGIDINGPVLVELRAAKLEKV
jgi:NADH-quinone oxidoreductase subunit G